jgi:hypothetical protein
MTLPRQADREKVAGFKRFPLGAAPAMSYIATADGVGRLPIYR